MSLGGVSLGSVVGEGAVVVDRNSRGARCRLPGNPREQVGLAVHDAALSQIHARQIGLPVQSAFGNLAKDSGFFAGEQGIGESIHGVNSFRVEN